MNPFRIILFVAALAGAQGAAQSPSGENGQARPQLSEAMERAVAAAANVDLDRLLSDAAYAREIIALVETLQPLAKDDPDTGVWLDGLRMFAQLGLGRPDEAWVLAQKRIAARPDEAQAYASAFVVAEIRGKPLDAVAMVEAASRRLVSQTGRREFRKVVADEIVRSVRFRLHEAKDEAALERLTEALLTLEWPGPDQPERMDWQRVTAIDGRLKKGDVAGARSLAAEIETPAPLVRLLVARRYDALFAQGEDRIVLVRLAVARQDSGTVDRLAANPGDFGHLLDRAQFLRSVGREADALALIEPHVADMAAVERGGEKAFWLVDEAAYALLSVGRAAEAVALLEKLIALGPDKHPQLINMAINLSAVLNVSGRFREGATLAAKLAAEQTRYASRYGEMWMWSSAACGLALGGDTAGAVQWLRKLEAASADNEAAHMRALLCLDDLDAAERLLLRRFESDEVADVLVALQDYQLDGGDTATSRLLLERWNKVRARPAVQAAIARFGRVMALPLSRTYWGEF